MCGECVEWMHSLEPALEATANKALEAFWKVVAECEPECTDYPLMKNDYSDLNGAARDIIQLWAMENLPLADATPAEVIDIRAKFKRSKLRAV